MSSDRYLPDFSYEKFFELIYFKMNFENGFYIMKRIIIYFTNTRVNRKIRVTNRKII